MNEKDLEKIKKLEEKMNVLKARKQKIENESKQKERKERTKRLIEKGAVVEKFLGDITLDELSFHLAQIKEGIKNDRND